MAESKQNKSLFVFVFNIITFLLCTFLINILIQASWRTCCYANNSFKYVTSTTHHTWNIVGIDFSAFFFSSCLSIIMSWLSYSFCTHVNNIICGLVYFKQKWCQHWQAVKMSITFSSQPLNEAGKQLLTSSHC